MITDPSPTAFTSFEVELPTPRLGAVIRGIDLREEADETTRAELRRALAERQVLFLPGQQITAAQHSRFAQIFGEPRPVGAFFPSHPDDRCIEVLEGNGEAIGTDIWHTDLSWQAIPPVATCLHSQVLPPVGGDTMWASMTAAYDGLSSRVREAIDGLQALHSWEKALVPSVRRGPDGQQRYDEARVSHPPVAHDVVQVHPDTGQQILFVNDLFTTEVVGVPRAEGIALLELLTAQARVPELQVRYRWEPDSVVIWDNRSVQHYAVTDYAPAFRRLHRITVDDPSAAFHAVPRP